MTVGRGAPRGVSPAGQRLRTSAVAAAVLGLDQATKALVLSRLGPAGSVRILGPFLSFTLVRNTGAAFGLFAGATAALAVVGAAAVVAAWLLSGRTHRPRTAWALGLVLGGALGNLVDRLLRHAVIDFVNVHVWPVFNVADSAVTVGAILLVWSIAVAPSPAPVVSRDDPTRP